MGTEFGIRSVKKCRNAGWRRLPLMVGMGEEMRVAVGGKVVYCGRTEEAHFSFLQDLGGLPGGSAGEATS